VIFPSGFVLSYADVRAYEVSTGYELSDYMPFGYNTDVDAAGNYSLAISLSTNVSVEVDISGRLNGGSGRVNSDTVSHYVPTFHFTSDKNLDIVISLGTIVNISGYDISINYTILIQLINNYMT
jgi:hypothetical protein